MMPLSLVLPPKAPTPLLSFQSRTLKAGKKWEGTYQNYQCLLACDVLSKTKVVYSQGLFVLLIHCF